MTAEPGEAAEEATNAPPPPARGVARRALVLVNGKSRRAPEMMETAVSKLDAYEDLEIVVEDCHDPETLGDVIRSHRDDVDMVVVGGGDGTMNAAARGIIDTGLPLGILPLGTANDLARTLGIPEDLEAAADIILRGRTRLIDCGEVNGRPFFNVASIGLSADLARELTRDLKRRFGRFGYAIAAARVLARARPFRATIECPQERARVTTFQIAVGNGRYYGGGMAVDETATIDDATLHLYSLEMRRPMELLLLAGAFRSGRHVAFQDVRSRAATEFTVTTRKSRSVNADGELITKTPAHFKVLARAVRVFVPDAPTPGLHGPNGEPPPA
ncbi:lipid kinase [Salinarimonas ramus]|uniref:Lipid kinase n=1 Tax=Salinarimonas ramus TaxID=690164 RepID=A0A917QG58_9HYPH|nr:lipid kinase [Salinarimonas ramus]GGK48317.1 lipid kinase [Salinarimonas ramus]